MAFPLPDVPSIAVLPFVNLSEDPKQEFFCDGMTDEIITALSKVPRLFVIARTSTSTYKGKPLRVKQVSEEMGVRYVLEGSFQRSPDRIRINAQLIDALTGRHIWAERYERNLKDRFGLQDEVTLKILKAMQLKLTEGEKGSLVQKWTYSENLECYLKYLEAEKYMERGTIEGNDLARRKAEEALALCPGHTSALLILAATYGNDYLLHTTKSPQASLKKAIELMQKAIVLDETHGNAHSMLGLFYAFKGEYDKALTEGERAMILDPSGAQVYARYGAILNLAGRPGEAIPMIQKGIRLNPYCPAWYYLVFGNALRRAGRFEEAVSAYRKAIQVAPDDISTHIRLADTYIMMGREKEARAEVEEIFRINPMFTLDQLYKTSVWKDPSKTDKFVNAMRKAGLK